MNKRGIALISGLLVIVVLSILLAPFFLKTINENNLVKNYVNSVRAFWLAEAGIAEAVSHLPQLTIPPTPIGDNNYTYSTTAELLATGYYKIISTGSVTLPTGEVTRKLEVIVKTSSIDPTKFKYAIETTTTLDIRGSVDINPDDSKKEHSALDFTDLFGYTKAQIRDSSMTNKYTPATMPESLSGVCWVDVPTGNTLTIAGNLEGNGVLIVSGDTHFSGTVDFAGIIYVIGKLTMTGTAICSGSVLAESTTTVDTTLKGNVTLNYDIAAITAALNLLSFFSKDIVSWREL